MNLPGLAAQPVPPGADAAQAAVLKLARTGIEGLALRVGQVLDARVLGTAAGGLTHLVIAGQTHTAQLTAPLPAGTMLKLEVRPGGGGPPLLVALPPGPGTVVTPPPARAQALPLPQPVVRSAPGPLAPAPVDSAATASPAAVAANPVAPAAARPAQAPASVPGAAAVSPAPAAAQAPAPVAGTVRAPVAGTAPAAQAVPRSEATPAPLPAGRAGPPGPAATSSAPGPRPAAPATQVPAPAAIAQSSGATAPRAAAPGVPPALPPVAPGGAAPAAASGLMPAAPQHVGPAASVAAAASPPTPVVPAAPGPGAPAAPIASPQPQAGPQGVEPPRPPVPAASATPAAAAAARNAPLPPAIRPPMPDPALARAVPLPPRPPASPAAQAVMAQATQAAARQDSVAPLLQNLAALSGRMAELPRPVAEAALRLMAGRISLDRGAPGAESLRQGVLRSGIFLEALSKRGAPQPPAPGDAKLALLALRNALSAWLGAEVAPVAPVGRKPPPPTRGGPPRGLGSEGPTLPDTASAREAGRTLLGQAEAALSRLRLLQLASLPPDAARATPGAAAEWNLELPMLLGHGLALMQLQIQRDGRGRREQRERGWRMAFSLSFPALGEVGAQVSLFGKGTSVAIWAAERETATALEEMLPQLAPALAARGLTVGSLRVRHGSPAPSPAPAGQLLDSVR